MDNDGSFDCVLALVRSSIVANLRSIMNAKLDDMSAKLGFQHQSVHAHVKAITFVPTSQFERID